MRIRDVYSGEFGLSIEVFPPKSEQGDAALWDTLERLQRFRPAFVSCTYGAGGTTRTRTIDICRTIQDRFGLAATAHFTCVGSRRDELLEWLELATRHGIGNIMALRGDPPQGVKDFQPVAGGLRHANELVALIREHHPEVGIGVAGYPEKHPEASDHQSDLSHLKRKVDSGADAVFTQLFFDNGSFFRFRDACTAAGIRVPIVPGIMPITEFARIKRITALCGAVIPAELASRLESAQDDAAAQFEIGVEYAIDQCRELLSAGVPGMHFYVLNKSQAGERILEALALSDR
jgi:methylenetetrahydrofolate reductase (NADPH)